MRHEIMLSGDGYALMIDHRTVATVQVRRRGNELWIVPSPHQPESIEPARATAALWGRAARRAFDEGVVAVYLASDIPLDHEDPHTEEAARIAGFKEVRDLLQLRRALPIPPDDPQRRGQPPLQVRGMRPGTKDEPAWISANNRAFAHHPDQGRETRASLRARMAEPWFDPAGLLVLDDDPRLGRLAGFCWTKVHPATDVDPALGEIYVIGVDPRHEGQGLGRGLVLAGLDHLASHGLTMAMLFVDITNEPALVLYDKLGFTPHLRHRVWTRRAPRAGTGRGVESAVHH